MRQYRILVVFAALSLPNALPAQMLDRLQKTGVTGAYDGPNSREVLNVNGSASDSQEALQRYEREMSSVAEETCDKLSEISKAVREDRLSYREAEYAIGETYALGLMRFQMLSSYHQILSVKLDRSEKEDSRPELDAPGTNEMTLVAK